MSSTYNKDLSLEIAFKLPSSKVFILPWLTREWRRLITEEFWEVKFIRDFGVILPFEANYELECIVMESLDIFGRYIHVIKQQYIDLLLFMFNWSIPDSILTYGVKTNNVEVVQLLIDNGASIHYRADEALRYAATNGHLEIVKLLLVNGADVHAERDESLRWAAATDYFYIVTELLDHGASIEVLGHFRRDNPTFNARIKKYLKDKKSLARV